MVKITKNRKMSAICRTFWKTLADICRKSREKGELLNIKLNIAGIFLEKLLIIKAIWYIILLRGAKCHKNERKGGENAMLTGKYNHSLDSKNRIIIPSKLKEQLGDTITILRGSDKCLTVYSAEEWEKYAQKIGELPKTKVKEVTRYLYSHSMEVKPDSQGRVMLTQEMMDFAGITKNIITVGCGKYAEIWSEEIWNEKNLDEEPENLTETLIELGL